MIVRVFVAGNGLSNWQLIVNQFDEEGAVDVVFLESLTVGFPVLDRCHVSGGPMISFQNNIIANSRVKCLATYRAAVSGGNGLSAAMGLGCIAGESGDGGGCVRSCRIVVLRESICLDVRLRFNREFIITGGIVLVGLNVLEVRWIEEQANGGDNLLKDVPIWL